MKALVITPTIGRDTLSEAISSVKLQETEHEVTHLIVIDGPEYSSNVKEIASGLTTMTLPYNVGAGGFFGHRVIAAMSHLVPEDYDYVFILDDDNWFEPNHIESCIQLAGDTQSEFVYALRSFYTHDGKFFAHDNCGSLGKWKIWDDGGHHLVDTSAYCFKRDFFQEYGSWWHHRYIADRIFYNAVRHLPHECTGERTLAYRLGDPSSDKYEEELKFVIENNLLAARKYPDGFPWENN